MKFNFFKKFEHKLQSVTIIILCLIPLVIFYKINLDNRVMIYMHQHHKIKYFIIKTMITILMLSFIMYLKEFIIN
jgi:hypothetical protein